MTMRDRWTETLHCPNCNTTGEAGFSQATGAAYSAGDQAIRVERVSDAFKAIQTEYGTSFCCAACQRLVEHFNDWPALKTAMA